ncbi:site-2 protease family protein [Streptomyces sp. CSDS2]|uniref:site-2 protease family protein n=1 Tax=Streptomyces sp. CSDS2 TaxID=3055051 RepID=UPI0025B04F29|nr:site-2 protease family protein [Streptomyces sp. CSDS2]MDN3260267.1 site-2 protease family protein [Streptomyces sp. CSDS2]
MDVSGGSGQPRSGDDRPAEDAADPTAPATGPTDKRGPGPRENPPEENSAPAPGANGKPTGDAPSDGGQHVTEAPAGGPSGGGQPTTDGPAENPSGGERPVSDGPANTPSRGERPAPHGTDTPDSRPTAHSTPPAVHTTPPAAHAPAERDQRASGASASGPADRDQYAPGTRTPAPAEPDQRAATPTPTPGQHHSFAHSGMAKGRPPGPRKEPGPGGGILMGRPFGVPVYVAPSWFLVAALITWVFGGQLDRVLPELGAARYLVSLFFAVAFYASVLVHELAHTVAAIRFKLPVRRIQLQFFGGVSEIEKEAETPGREFVLAFVGPLLSLVLASLFYLAMKPVEPGTVPGVLLAGLMISNLIVAIFNFLPGLPLDGGRMLRAVVWKITGKPMSGTIAAAWVGRALAVSVLIGLPLLNSSGVLGDGGGDVGGMDTVTDALLAAILAAIIWTGAGNSLRMARLREHLPELRARTLTRRAVPVENDTPLSEALRRANAAGARALVVVDADGTPVSLVREAAIVGVPEHRRPWVAVSGLAQELTDGMRVSAELAGEDLLDVLRATPATEYLVVEETGEIYGVLSAADVERAFVRAMARPAP